MQEALDLSFDRLLMVMTVQSVRVAISVPTLSEKYVGHGYGFSILKKNQGNHKKN